MFYSFQYMVFSPWLSLFLESFLDACINRIFFLLPLPDISLLVQRNAKDFSKLILLCSLDEFIYSFSYFLASSWLPDGHLFSVFSHALFSVCVCVCVCVHMYALEL